MHTKVSSLVRVLLGMVLLNDTFVYIFGGTFTHAGHKAVILRLNYLASQAGFGPIKAGLMFFSHNLFVLSVVFCAVMLIAAAMLLIGRINLVSTLVAAITFLVLFLTHVGDPHEWVFMYVMPCGFACLLSYFYYKQGHNQSLELQSSDFGHIPWSWFSVGAVFLFAALFWVNKVSLSEHTLSTIQIAIFAFVATGLLVVNRLINTKVGAAATQASKVLYEENQLIACLYILVGVMLVVQVKLNVMLGWFTLHGYLNLIGVYQKYSHAPAWLLGVAAYIKENASIALAIQSVIEPILGLCFVTLLIRPIASLASTLLFVFLAVIEFGVPASFPVVAPIRYTWTWELLLTACVTAVLCYHEIRSLISGKHYLDAILAKPSFFKMSLLKRFMQSIAVSVVLFCIFMLRNHHDPDKIVWALSAALTIFIYMVIMHYIDLLRCRRSEMVGAKV